jgi:hypothetical protein
VENSVGKLAALQKQGAQRQHGKESLADHRRSHPVDGLSCAAIVVSAAVVASAGV